MREVLQAAIAQVAESMHEDCRVPDGTPIFAACSGGADSCFLVDALAAHRERWPLAGVIFIDHGLRDVDAEADASRNAAERAGAPWTRRAVRLEEHGNVQENARVARYEALLAEAPDDALVATGHTLDDQGETVLQRLIRGSGLRGLSAIAPRDGRLIRPMLAVSGSTIRAAGLPYADDPTNATDRFQRNRIRHAALPLLEKESPGATVHLARLASRAAEEIRLIDAILDRLDARELDLGGLPTEIAAAVTRWRSNRELPRSVRPRSQAIDQVAKLLVDRAQGASTSLGQGWAARASSGRLTFERDDDTRESLVLPSPGSYRLRHVAVELIPANQVHNGTEVENSLETWLRTDALRWPLKLTREPAREHGERRWLLHDAPGNEVWRSDRPVVSEGGELLFRMIFSL